MKRCMFAGMFVCLFLMCAGVVLGDTYTEDFTQDPGAPEDWVVLNPAVLVEDGQLTLAPSNGAEIGAAVGDAGVGIYFDEITHIEADIAFPGETAGWPYDHGGITFCGVNAAGRYSNTCYVVDYLAEGDGIPERGRFRMAKFINGAENPLAQTEINITSYEGKWEIDITPTTITFTFDGVEQMVVEDSELRGGYVGFWAYQAPAENKMAIDNVIIEHNPGDCPSFLMDKVGLTEGAANALLPVRIPYGANATEAYTVTVVSDTPAVATPINSPLTFEVGGPQVQYLEIEAGVGGETLMSLGVAGADCTAETVLVEVLAAVAYQEDFTQDDGLPEGWFIASTTATVINNELSLSAPGQPFCWYAIDGEPVNVAKMESVSCRIKFSQAAMPVGAHGGIYLSPDMNPNNARNKGYMIDVIERASDNGYRIYKDNNAAVGSCLVEPRPPYVWDDQWHVWKIDFTPTGFNFTVDDVLIGEVNDLTYRGGYLAFWCYTGAAGQNVFVDDIEIVFGASACPNLSPAARETLPGLEMIFTLDAPFSAASAGDYAVDVTSTAPEVAAGVGAVDGTLTVDTFPQSDTFSSTTFNVQGLAPGTTELLMDIPGSSCLDTATVTVLEPTYFIDEFVQDDGPPAQWTIYEGRGWPVGDWQVVGEQLVIESTGGGEKWLWAGAPAIPQAATKYSFDMVVTQETPDGVGRHGGVMFCAKDATNRWDTSGYSVDWIDREQDRGYRFSRHDNGVATPLITNTGDTFLLGTAWEIEFAGTEIILTVDDTEIARVEDTTYRGGYFGLWTYGNNTHFEYDNIVIGEELGVPLYIGDSNCSGKIDLSDAICILTRLFGAEGEACKDPCCEAAMDTNNDNKVDLSDAVRVLSWQFTDGELEAPDGTLMGSDGVGCMLYPMEEDMLPCATPCQ